MQKYGDKEFTADELKALIPQKAYETIGKADPKEMEINVRYNLNVDEQYKSDVLFAYSYYQALNDRQRSGVHYAISNLSIVNLLSWIGNNNEKLIDAIELMDDNGLPVIEWLENQLLRVKAMILSFDEKIREESK